jgi:hypothetical protein
LSRAFFEKNLIGSVELTSAGTELANSETHVSWRELPPTSPAPTGDYYADFRDRQGCAGYQDSYEMKLCFTVVPDVSSVDLTGEKLQLQGFERVLAEKTSCRENPTLRFIEAKKDQSSITVMYSAEYSSCPAAQLKLVLREA